MFRIECSFMERFYAYLQIKQDISMATRYGSKEYLEKAKNLSLGKALEST